MRQATAVRCDSRKTGQNVLARSAARQPSSNRNLTQGPVSQPFSQIQLETGADPSTDFAKGWFLRQKCFTEVHVTDISADRPTCSLHTNSGVHGPAVHTSYRHT
eukprot:3934633-Prymnesium_polylepis.2